MSARLLRYKYVPLDDSFKEPPDYKAGSLCIITDGTMKFSHPDEFNDPFDCRPDVDIRAISKQVKKSISQEDIDQIIEHEKGKLSPADRLIERRKYLNKQQFSEDDYFKIMNDRVGICSLSRNPLNLLMWAHYASKHTGFVVEFSVPTIISHESEQFKTYEDYYFDGFQLLIPLEVHYEKDKPVVNSDEETHKKHFLTKSIDWQYEEEERVLDDVRKAGIHPYNRKQVLKSVIAGMKMTDENFVTLKNAVAKVNKELGINVTVHKAQAVTGKFALFVPDRKDLNIHNEQKMQN